MGRFLAQVIICLLYQEIHRKLLLQLVPGVLQVLGGAQAPLHSPVRQDSPRDRAGVQWGWGALTDLMSHARFCLTSLEP